MCETYDDEEDRFRIEVSVHNSSGDASLAIEAGLSNGAWAGRKSPMTSNLSARKGASSSALKSAVLLVQRLGEFGQRIRSLAGDWLHGRPHDLRIELGADPCQQLEIHRSSWWHAVAFGGTTQFDEKLLCTRWRVQNEVPGI